MTTAPRLTLWPKRLIYLAYGVGALALIGAMGWTWRQGVPLLLPLVVAELLFHYLVNERFPALEQRVLTQLKAGADQVVLLQLIQEQRLLRFASPRYRLQGLFGLIFSQLGQHAPAAAAYRDALEEAPPAKAFPLAVGLGDSLFELGELKEAEEIYRESMDDKHHSSRACTNLARIIQRRGGEQEEAEIYLRQAAELSHDPALRLELADLLLAMGREEDAQFERDLAGEQKSSDEVDEGVKT